MGRVVTPGATLQSGDSSGQRSRTPGTSAAWGKERVTSGTAPPAPPGADAASPSVPVLAAPRSRRAQASPSSCSSHTATAAGGSPQPRTGRAGRRIDDRAPARGAPSRAMRPADAPANSAPAPASGRRPRRSPPAPPWRLVPRAARRPGSRRVARRRPAPRVRRRPRPRRPQRRSGPAQADARPAPGRAGKARRRRRRHPHDSLTRARANFRRISHRARLTCRRIDVNGSPSAGDAASGAMDLVPDGQRSRLLTGLDGPGWRAPALKGPLGLVATPAWRSTMPAGAVSAVVMRLPFTFPCTRHVDVDVNVHGHARPDVDVPVHGRTCT